MGQLAPSFSVVVPTYARPRQLGECLRAMTRLEYPRDRLEVIVVQDGGPAVPEALVAEVRDLIPLRIVSQANAGPAAARNAGAALATGDWLVFVDDDCLVAPDYLRRLADHVDPTARRAIGGRSVNALAANPFASASQLLIDYLYAYFETASRESRFFTSNNLAVPRRLFAQIAGFDTGFRRAGAEDRDLCHRLLAGGCELHFAPDAVVFHSHDMKLGAFVRQHFNYGSGAFCFHQKRATANGERIRVEPFSFYRRLVVSPFNIPEVERPVVVSALLTLSQVANAAGFLWEAYRTRK